MIFMVEKDRKKKRNAGKTGKEEVSGKSKRTAYLEFLVSEGDKSIDEKRQKWRAMSVKERTKYQEMADKINN